MVKKYNLEDITEKFCASSGKDIRILRLPVGHSELNAIELIWAQVKSEVARKNTTFKIRAVKELLTNALQNVTKANWKKAIDHTKKVDDAFSQVDFGDFPPPAVSGLIVKVRPEDESNSESEPSSESEQSSESESSLQSEETSTS